MNVLDYNTTAVHVVFETCVEEAKARNDSLVIYAGGLNEMMELIYFEISSEVLSQDCSSEKSSSKNF